MKDKDFGFPEIDEQTGKVIGWLFKALSGCIPSMQYSDNNDATIENIMAQYAYALIRHKISDIESLTLGIERLVDSDCTFLPPPGTFVKMCKEAVRIKKNALEMDRVNAQNRAKMIDDRAYNTAMGIWQERGNSFPTLSDFGGIANVGEWIEDKKRCSNEINEIKKELLIGCKE